eukprot:GHRR01020730.1.p1 GENE.GHRR01020730.1~~GHRR01020730.1.p1  ORF type:complete len:533 (+),score=170.54 GHRR01020730.1:3275-4873(+)
MERARQLYCQKRFVEAFEACKHAATSCKNMSSDPEYIALLDEICMHGAATGQVIGFKGRLLQVQPAVPSMAWLGMGSNGARDGSATNPATGAPTPRVTQFSSLAEALGVAVDGDVIQLLPGTHVVSQVCLNITKRILIEGLGASHEQVLLDHRANHPVFTISRACILRNLTIDMVGFCEAVIITGSSTTVKPILQDLHIMCSGHDGLSIGGNVQPLLSNCHIQVRCCCIKQYGSSSTTFWNCTLTGGQHGLMACGNSQAFLEGCKVDNCGQDGIIGLQQASLHLSNTTIKRCKGPGLDLSDSSSAVLSQVEVEECCGGLWIWHTATCEAVSCYISGGSSYAVLLDEEAYARGSSCQIDGPCHMSADDGNDCEAPCSGPPVPVKRAGTSWMLNAASDIWSQHYGADAACVVHCAAGPGVHAVVDANATAVKHSKAVVNNQNGNPSLQADMPLDKQQQQQLYCLSPSLSGSCSDSSSSSMLQSVNGMANCGLQHSRNAEYMNLVQRSMLVSNAAVAAALFPPEQGAFAYEPQVY